MSKLIHVFLCVDKEAPQPMYPDTGMWINVDNISYFGAVPESPMFTAITLTNGQRLVVNHHEYAVRDGILSGITSLTPSIEG